MQTIQAEVFAEVTDEVQQSQQPIIAAIELLDSQLSLIGGGFGGVPLF